MRYLDEKLKNALSCEYVLGTLRGAARSRYQRLMRDHAAIRQNVWYWEKQLNALGASLSPREPDAGVWEAIETRLGFVDATGKIAVPWWKSWLSAPVAALATLLLAVTLWWPGETPRSEAERLVVIQTERAEALWVIEWTPDALAVQATRAVVEHADNDYELWMVPEDGTAPRSLGLLPKRGRRELPRVSAVDNTDIKALAVSLEPLGGSPSGQPTEVLYASKVVAL